MSGGERAVGPAQQALAPLDEWLSTHDDDVRELVAELIAERDEARVASDRWREQAWMEGYPKDSGDREPWDPPGYIVPSWERRSAGGES